MNWADLQTVAPIVAAILLAGAILVVDFILPGRERPAIAVSLVGLAIVAVVTLVTGQTTAEAFDGAYSQDALTTFLDILFIAIIVLTILFAPDYLESRDLPIAEFSAVLVFAMTGAMLIAGSTDLLLLFLGLELMVLPGYMLAGFAKRDALSTEGAIKYFLLGSFSSAIFLFGLAFTWGLSGSTRVADVASHLADIVSGGAPLSVGLAMGLAFLTTGVAFKIAAVPFHYWTPDAYQGSPTPVTGYLSVLPKIGAFALILRLFVGALDPLKGEWLPVIEILAVLTMTLGNLVALTQTNVKRMLAYSSIAHTGYILLGSGGLCRGTDRRHRGGALLRRRLHVHEPRGIRGGRGAPAAARRDEPPRHVCRTGPARAGPRRTHDPVPVVVDRDSAVRRVLRQGVRDPGRRRGRRDADDPGRHRRAERRDRRVLLPARGRVHVHARSDDRSGTAAPREPGLGWPLDGDGAHDRAGPLPGAAAGGGEHGGAGAGLDFCSHGSAWPRSRLLPVHRNRSPEPRVCTGRT